jgi:hypothetical protein
MTATRVLIIATEAVTDRPAALPEVVQRQVLGAGQVRVVAPTLTTKLKSLTSDTDGATKAAGTRMRAIVARIEASGQPAIRGDVGDEDPLQALADALVTFSADALILAAHTPDAQSRGERRLRESARARFQLPGTEMLIDGDGHVVSVHADEHA